MDKVQAPSNSECHTQPSEPFRFYSLPLVRVHTSEYKSRFKIIHEANGQRAAQISISMKHKYDAAQTRLEGFTPQDTNSPEREREESWGGSERHYRLEGGVIET
jgi:hypothetical protein